jgi:DNA-binding LacI/PurR family transcriptional regulator
MKVACTRVHAGDSPLAITIKDIAKQAGVNHATVSRALRGSSLISAETTGRIKEIAAELGYQPSAAARSLKTNRSQVLGVIVSHIDDPFFSEILQGIDEAAQHGGYSLFFAASQRSLERELAIVRTMRAHSVDGVILCSTPFSSEHTRLLREYARPIVVINNQAAEDYRYSIYHDDVDGSRQLTRHLIELGHKKIAYLGNTLSGRTTQNRVSGFQQELAAASLICVEGYIHQVPGGSPADGFAACSHFLNLIERPTAIVCYNDMLAIGLLQALQQAGLCVPEDISVTGFDNIVFSAYTHPPLTTFDQPKRFIGAEAARLLMELLQTAEVGAATAPQTRLLKGQLLVRKSTAPPTERNTL